MVFDQQLEVLSAIEGDIKRLFDEHRQRREHWYFHEFVPWEQGRSYVEEPWDVSQCTISEAARTSLVLNLLTEDNLPYYHSAIESRVPGALQLSRQNRGADWKLRHDHPESSLRVVIP